MSQYTMKKNIYACASIEDSNQLSHNHSLIQVFDGRSMGSQGSNISSGGNSDTDQAVQF